MIELTLSSGCKTLISKNLIERIEQVADYSTSGGEREVPSLIYFVMREHPILVTESIYEIEKKIKKSELKF
jgi:uncharacterized protein YlzI (FlbEa/FlbD family)